MCVLLGWRKAMSEVLHGLAAIPAPGKLGSGIEGVPRKQLGSPGQESQHAPDCYSSPLKFAGKSRKKGLKPHWGARAGSIAAGKDLFGKFPA